MRTLLAAAMVAAIASPPAYGQSRTEARKSAVPDLLLPRYRVEPKADEPYVVHDYEQKGEWYVFTDVHGRKSTYPASSISRVVPLEPHQSVAIVDASPSTSGTGHATARTRSGMSIRIGPRIEARTQARLKPPPRKRRAPVLPPPAWNPFVGFGAGAGYSATGIPLHVGPRGGVYHYSANGNKVYHSRK